MKLEDFLGSYKQIQILVEWLNRYYHEPTAEISNYVIIWGPPGNGKSLLPELLAKEFGIDLFKITPLDSLNINDIIKSVNVTSFDGSNHKLILVDDLDEYPIRVRTELCKIPEISNHPIIYTCKVAPYKNEKFIRGSLKDVKGKLIYIGKPLTSELLEYLKTKSNLPIEQLDKIARESRSVRSALLSIHNQSVNTLTNPIDSLGTLLRKVNNRCVDKPLDRYTIETVFKSIRGYGKDELKVMLKFAEFDYRAKGKFEDIDPIFINEMLEPIEKVKLEYQYTNNSNGKKSNTTKKPKAVIKKKSKPKPKQKGPSVDSWL